MRNVKHLSNELVNRAVAEHQAYSRACDARWQDELERRRAEIAQRCSVLR